MVAHAQATESERDFGTFVNPDDDREARAFRGSFSGYERSAFFLSPGVGQPYIEIAHGLALDDDEDGRAVAAVDVDGDGDLDLAALSVQSLRLFLNPSPPRHFVRVRLQASKGDPLALGAQVKVEAGGRAQLAPVRLTEGFHTQVQPELHFGLGDAAGVDAIEVRWPGGRVQRFGPAPADRLLVLRDDAEAPEVRAIPAWPPGTGPTITRGALDAPVETLEGARVPVAPRGRPAVVNFWAPWCKACERELPVLVRLAQDLGPDVRFVGVSLEREDKAGVQAFAARHGVPYPTPLATEEAVAAFFGPGAEVTLPVTFVFGPDGVIRRAFHREVTAEEVRSVLGTLATAPAPEDFIELADRAHGLGQADEERALLAKALAAAPDDPVTLTDVAERLMRLRDPEQARAILEDGVKRRPAVPELWAVLGAARGARGDLPGAEAAIKQALALAPRNPVALNSEGMLFMMRGQNAEAADRFRAAIDADPLYPLPRANLQHVESLLPP